MATPIAIGDDRRGGRKSEVRRLLSRGSAMTLAKSGFELLTVHDHPPTILRPSSPLSSQKFVPLAS